MWMLMDITLDIQFYYTISRKMNDFFIKKKDKILKNDTEIDNVEKSNEI